MTEAQVRAELARLLSELDSFKNLMGFHERAFSSKSLPEAIRWYDEVDALKKAMAQETELSVQVRAAPSYLMSLGIGYRNSKGQETDMTRWDRNMVVEALEKK